MFRVLLRACGGAVGTSHRFLTSAELDAFLAGVDAAVTLIEAEVIVTEDGRQLERRVVGGEEARRRAGAWVHRGAA